jgi:hypothetical protein
MLAAEARSLLTEKFGWKQIGVGDDYGNGKAQIMLTITTDEKMLIRSKWNPTCSSEGFPLEILSDVDLATVCSGGTPAGFSATKPKVGQAGSLF